MGRNFNGIHRRISHFDGKNNIFVMVERLTKYVHFMENKRTNSTKQIFNVSCKNIYKLHYFSKVIVSNRDPKSKRNFWKEFCKQIRISLNMSSTYHPQTNGQI